jgi:hypothetical protein
MPLNIGKEIAAMEEMPVAQLRNRCAEVVGDTTNARNKQWLLKKIIWRLQSLAEGNLSERARARAMEIASGADIRRRPPKAPAPKPDAPQSPPVAAPDLHLDARKVLAGAGRGALCLDSVVGGFEDNHTGIPESVASARAPPRATLNRQGIAAARLAARGSLQKDLEGGVAQRQRNLHAAFREC